MTTQRQQVLAEGGIDYEDALDRLGGNAELYERVVQRYLDDTHVAQLEETLEAGDCEAAHCQAHALKGMAGNLSFKALYAASASLDNAAREGRLDEARALMADVRSAHAAVVHALQQVF